MVSVVAKPCTAPAEVSSTMTVQEKGSRNKRKFRADSPLADPTNIINLPQNECKNFEFIADNCEIIHNNGNSNGCDMCGSEQDGPEALKLDLGLSFSMGSDDFETRQPREQTTTTKDIHNADWSDLSESHLEELVLSNLDAIFKSAIKKIVAYGYSDEVVSKAVLRPGICYGRKDTVSNIIDNTLAFLRSDREMDSSREHYFGDLQQLLKYILVELVCVLREVRPFFSTGDAMWCLLICDMNVKQACVMDSEYTATSGNSSSSEQVHQQTGTRYSEPNESGPFKPLSLSCGHTFAASAPSVAGPSNLKGNSTFVINDTIPHKMCSNSSYDKSFTAVRRSRSTEMEEKFVGSRKGTGITVGTSRSTGMEEKFVGSRKGSGITKREYILRQKSIHLDKHYGSGSKGAREKITSFGGLFLDKKLKSVVESPGLNVKYDSSINKTVGVITGNPCLKSMHPNVPPFISAVNVSTSLPVDETELSLSFPANGIPSPANSKYPATPNNKFHRKDEIIMKLATGVRELENHLRDWTEWANQKVMQAARRLGKDKAELKTLKQEKQEVERIKKEKQTLESNTMKKLSEMESALRKTNVQVDRANAAVLRLEIENETLRQEMEAAKLRALESASSCREASNREKKTLMKMQSWEKQKVVLQEELTAERQKLAQLEPIVEQAKILKVQIEGRWKQEQKAKEDLLAQAKLLRAEREKIQSSVKSKEDVIRSRAESKLKNYQDDINKLQKEISLIRLNMDSPKIAALKKGMDVSYTAPKGTNISYIISVAADFPDYPESGDVKRDRECVMCLSEEMAVVFLPCAHQVVCVTCNDLHEKQGMKDCPSCRSPIQQRISVRYARS